MELLPGLQLGLTNGWLPLAAFFTGYGLLLLYFPREVRERLYDRTGWTRTQRIASIIGLPFALAAMLLIVLAPLKLGRPIFLVGLAIYFPGVFAFVLALFDFKKAPADMPATHGMYRWSRNPQWAAFGLVVLSTGLMVGSLAAIGLLSVRIALNHFRILGEERACLSAYGDAYLDYMERVPRYGFGL